jgi:hypothetical protein
MTAKYAWTITQDKEADPTAKPGTNANAVGVVGPSSSFLKTPDEIKAHPTAKKFRMKDDDGEVYYEGLIAFADTDLIGTETEFRPLDQFGMPNAGCTSIEYLENGKWCPL